MTEVEGGLAEPTELEPEQGSLELADPGDRWTSADWEKSAAAVLRKARRLGEDDPDSRVWEKLSRTTLDDIAVLPLGTAAVLDEVETSGRPTRSGDWDIRVHLNGPDAKLANEAALVDLNGGATSLWLELGAGLTPEDLDATLADVLLDLAPVVLDAPAAPLAAAEALVAVLDDRGVTPADGTNLGADPIGARVRGVVSTGSTTEERRRPPRRRWSRSPSSRARRGRWAWSSTPPRSTTSGRPTRRSSATAWRSGRRTSARSPRPGSRSTRRSA